MGLPSSAVLFQVTRADVARMLRADALSLVLGFILANRLLDEMSAWAGPTAGDDLTLVVVECA